MPILNLTQHDNLTPEQIAAGVIQAQGEDREKIKQLLTFDAPPAKFQKRRRAFELALLARQLCEKYGCNKVMIGGALFLIRYLEEELENAEVDFVYSFSKRVSEDIPQPDGSVKKVSRHKHLDFC